MRSISQLIDHTLTLVQPKWTKSSFELRFGDEMIAEITFPKAMSLRARITTAEGSWFLWREGFFKQRLLAIREGETDNAASGTADGWKGTTEIIFKNGKKYIIKPNVWKSLTEIRKETGEVMVTLRKEGTFHPTTKITMNRTASVTPDLPLLVLFGIYAVILQMRDSHALIVAVGI